MMTEGQKAKHAMYEYVVNADTSAKRRLAALFDNGSYTEIGAYAGTGDRPAGVAAAFGYVNGVKAYAFSQDVSVMSGAVSAAHADKICRTLELAAKNGTPVIGIYDSCGAFAEDGADALNAYGRILSVTNNISGVVPQIAVIAGVCSGSSAMIAECADIVIMAQDAQFYMAAGADSGSAETAARSGAVSLTAATDIEAVELARNLVMLIPQNNLSPVPEFEYSESDKPVSGTAAEIAAALADADSVTELSSGFGTAAYTALATIGGATAGIVATNKTKARLTGADCDKIARFVRFCDSFSIPVVTAVDTEGFELSAASDKAGSVRDIARLSNAYAEATTVKLAVVTGKACGSAFVALAGSNANADMTFAYADSVIAAMDPVAAAEFLYHDELKEADDVKAKRNELAQRYADEFGSAADAAAKAAVDVITDPVSVRAAVISALYISSGKRADRRFPKKHGNAAF